MSYRKRILQSLGITPNYRGFWILLSAIALVMENESRLTLITKKLYPVLAQEFETTTDCIERNIRTVVDVCWNYGNRKLLDQIAGYHLPNKPNNASFISILVMYIMDYEEASQQEEKA